MQKEDENSSEMMYPLHQPIDLKEKHQNAGAKQCEKNAPSKVDIFDQYAKHEIGRELNAMSDWLDENLDLLDWVVADIKQRNVENKGRKGLTVESVLRCAVLKQYRQLSYEDLVFCLMDSVSCQTFARLTMAWTPKKSTLQSCISAISEVTWEQINQRLLHSADKAKKEQGKMLRIDSTVIESPIHAPSDSSLLWDSVRVLIRLLKHAEELTDGVTTITYVNHQLLAKKRARAIWYTWGKEKKELLYRDLIVVTEKSLGYVEEAGKTLLLAGMSLDPLACKEWQLAFEHYKPLILKDDRPN